MHTSQFVGMKLSEIASELAKYEKAEIKITRPPREADFKITGDCRVVRVRNLENVLELIVCEPLV